VLGAWCRTAVVVAVAIISTACIGAAPAAGAISCSRYASPTGRDAATGSLTAPFRTAQKLVDSLRAGQTGCLRAGRYEQAELLFGAAGTSSARITLTSYPGERATISAQKVYVPPGADFVTISSLDVDGGPYDAPTVEVMADDAVVEDDVITNHNLAESCIVLGNLKGYGAADRAAVRRNRFPDCGNPANGLHDHAIYLESAADATITDNVIWNAAGFGIQLYPDAQRTLVSRNVIDASTGGIIVGGASATGEYAVARASSGTQIEYNVITNAWGKYGVQSTWGGGAIGTGNLVRYNCFFQNVRGNVDLSNGGLVSFGNRNSDPLYLSAASQDYRLRQDSPCMRADVAGNPPPTVTLTKPVGGTAFGDYLCPGATAADDDRVLRVRFYLDGVAKLTDDSPPYGSCFSTATTATGRHVVTARAYDVDGGAATSAVSVYRGLSPLVTAGTTPPSIALIRPGTAATFGDYLCAAASASDDVRVTRVRFYLDGKLVLDDDAPPYGSCVQSGLVAAGAHSLSANAYDGDLGSATSVVSISKPG
jgi:hypothetical protein